MDSTEKADSQVNKHQGNRFSGPIWDGIYSNFKDAPCSGEGYSNDQWATQSLDKVTKMLTVAKNSRTSSSLVAYRASLLPFLTALVGEKQDCVKILDFGGGLGVTFLSTVSGLVEKTLDFYIVENKRICELGNRIFKNDDRIHFYTSLPDHIEVDIVHLGSSLHYVDEWRDLLGKLARFCPLYFLLTDLTAGEISTYVTVQNFYGSKIPCWFFNINDVIDQMNFLGFKLLFKSTFRGTYLGKEQDIPQDNFPEELRLGNTCSVLFGREEK